MQQLAPKAHRGNLGAAMKDLVDIATQRLHFLSK
jgi:hypothetical protein